MAAMMSGSPMVGNETDRKPECNGRQNRDRCAPKQKIGFGSRCQTDVPLHVCWNIVEYRCSQWRDFQNPERSAAKKNKICTAARRGGTRKTGLQRRRLKARV